MTRPRYAAALALARLGAIVAGIAVGFIVGHAHADPIPLTRTDLARISDINRSINASMPMRRADGVGNCVAVAERKYQALISAGYPSYAVHTVTVRSPGWGSPLHRLVVVETMHGPVYLDMNTPWLLDARQAAGMGYRAYVTDWSAAFAK